MKLPSNWPQKQFYVNIYQHNNYHGDRLRSCCPCALREHFTCILSPVFSFPTHIGPFIIVTMSCFHFLQIPYSLLPWPAANHRPRLGLPFLYCEKRRLYHVWGLLSPVGLKLLKGFSPFLPCRALYALDMREGNSEANFSPVNYFSRLLAYPFTSLTSQIRPFPSKASSSHCT